VSERDRGARQGREGARPRERLTGVSASMPASPTKGRWASMRFVPLFLVGLLAAPASALAADEGSPGGTDHTMQIMLGLIIFLMVALVVIGALEQRKPH